MTAEAARPMRADARRNYERILATAREAFTEEGTDVPLDDIAKRACVGAGTLYRHFPTREKLFEAVYRDEVETLAQHAFDLLAELPPGEALEAWMRNQVRYYAERRGLTVALKAALDHESETFALCRSRTQAASGALVSAAQEAGLIRDDVTGTDVLRLCHGVGSVSQYATPEDVERMLGVVLDGLRAG
ncbi:TetR/AcrR family transcriptional regulator [Amycolatopsis sp. NPDC059021]|uniref:TetR/AcrR family transcriptional regulator n=1 Tax=Amycolatopsis sp. NPDC059021 TaxID=3346704 RepID=UPI0036720802